MGTDYNVGAFGGTAGGTAIDLTVEGGSIADVYAGGLTIGTTVSGSFTSNMFFSTEQLWSGASASNTSMTAGAGLVVNSGGTDLGGSIITDGGGEAIFSGGTLFGTTTVSGVGIVQVDAGATISGGIAFTAPQLLAAALQITGSSIPTGLLIADFNLGDIIELNGINFDPTGSATVSGGSTLDVREGGSDYNISFGIDLSEYQFGLGGGTAGPGGGTYVTITGVTLGSGQSLSGAAIGGQFGASVTVGSGATVSDSVVGSSGTVAIASGGTATGVSVTSGGSESVGSGGTSLSGSVADGGSETVASGGVISDTTFGDPGSGTVTSGGSAVDVLVSGGVLVVDSGGISINTTVVAGGTEIISSGGIVSGIVISSGGTADLMAGTLNSGTIVLATAGATIQIGDTASGVLAGLTLSDLSAGDIVDLTGVAFVSSGSGFVSGGDLVVSVGSGGSTYDVPLANQSITGAGYELILAPDVGSGTEIIINHTVTATLGATDSVTSGLIDTNDVVLSGGTLIIESGGLASSATVSSGGVLIVGSGGLDCSATVRGSDIISGLDVSGTVLLEGTGCCHPAAARPARHWCRRPARWSSFPAVLEFQRG